LLQGILASLQYDCFPLREKDKQTETKQEVKPWKSNFLLHVSTLGYHKLHLVTEGCDPNIWTPSFCCFYRMTVSFQTEISKSTELCYCIHVTAVVLPLASTSGQTLKLASASCGQTVITS
jgi:hypothetical protein